MAAHHSQAPVCVVLGNNIIEGSIRQAKEKFEKEKQGAKILLEEVPDPERFGLSVFENGRMSRIDEKPERPYWCATPTGT